MAGVLQPAEQFPVDEHRADEAHIHEMRTAEIGVVDDINIARLRRRHLALTDQADQFAGRILHGANENRQAEFALRNQRPRCAVVNAVRAVIRFGDDRRKRRA